MAGVEGFIYPNEVELQWSVLIVLYPFITGLVAGAFILASLERVFNVSAVRPTYRLALLTALAFLIVAPLPLQMHLGHPERSYEMYITPHRESAMAMFGFVYLWYLMGVLVLEIWFDYRKDLVLTWKSSTGLKRQFYGALTLWSDDITPEALRIDDKIGRFITIVGIPSAFLLHGYVGFIFGSIKANPWWSTPLMPVVFLFSAIVSGVAAVMLLYMALCRLRRVPIDMPCLDTIARYLYYAFLIDFSLELLDLIHRIYEAGDSFGALGLHGQDQALRLAHRDSDLPRHAAADPSARGDTDHPVQRHHAAQDLRHGRSPDARRHLRDALERRHRRSTLLEEPARLHNLQNGVCDARGSAPGNHHHGAAVRDSGRAAADTATLGRPGGTGEAQGVTRHGF